MWQNCLPTRLERKHYRHMDSEMVYFTGYIAIHNVYTDSGGLPSHPQSHCLTDSIAGSRVSPEWSLGTCCPAGSSGSPDDLPPWAKDGLVPWVLSTLISLFCMHPSLPFLLSVRSSLWLQLVLPCALLSCESSARIARCPSPFAMVLGFPLAESIWVRCLPVVRHHFLMSPIPCRTCPSLLVRRTSVWP